jgi:hypothetical protein
MANPDADTAADRYAEAIRREHKEVQAAIDAVTSPQQALDPAQRVLEATKTAYEAAMELRDRVVGRIWNAEEMTAAAMADRLNVTPQRVGQIAKAQRVKEQP